MPTPHEFFDHTGKPELRVSATGASDFEGAVGHQLNLAVVPAQPQPGIVRVVAAVYNGQNIPVNESDFSITIAGGRSILVLVIHAMSDGQTLNLVEQDSTGNQHVLATLQYHHERPTASYTIQGMIQP